MPNQKLNLKKELNNLESLSHRLILNDLITAADKVKVIYATVQHFSKQYNSNQIGFEELQFCSQMISDTINQIDVELQQLKHGENSPSNHFKVAIKNIPILIATGGVSNMINKQTTGNLLFFKPESGLETLENLKTKIEQRPNL
ncbi:hypothetical protein [Legionella sainthelensi]|uniref:hypothetical protein n=1 Tax=Legionella sainthelensi TaxID=28087 RepID=UPI000E208417|nr:hypothetical protein [Legionella sainthelensi]